MVVIRLDARGWRGPADIYDALLPALGAPDWHGRNLDALYDSLSSDINALEPPFSVLVEHCDGLPDEVSDYLAKMESVFTDAAKDFGHEVSFTWR
jgi:RNAse (barnase) inhibitor barstar